MGGGGRNTGAVIGGLFGGPAGALAGKEGIDRPTRDAEQMMMDQANVAMKSEQELIAKQEAADLKRQQEKEDEAQAESSGSSSRAKRKAQRSKRLAGSGRQGTILTSPLGSVANTDSGVAKTLLGN